MALNLDMIKTYLEEHAAEHKDDAVGVLDALYGFYQEQNAIMNQRIVEGFSQIHKKLKNLSFKQMDEIISNVCELCQEYEQMAFTEGVRIGVRLMTELR